MKIYSISFLFSVVVIAFLFLVGCDPEEDTESPEVTVSLPAPGSVYENGDTIRFSAVMSDNAHLSNVEVLLVDKDNKPSLPVLSISPGQNHFTYTGEYIISDPLLPGGVYQLRFQASDGINVTNHFVEIQIHELQREMLYPLIVTHPNAAGWQVFRLNANNDWNEFYLHTGDYCGSAVNSEAAHFYICGKTQSNLIALRLQDAVLQWQVKPVNHQSLRWFEALNFSSPLLYVSCAEGTIRGYDKMGNEVYKTSAYSNAFPGLSTVTFDFVTASFKDAFSKDNFLVSFHNQGGLMIYSKFSQTDFIGLFNTGINNILVFGNRNGQGEVQLYNGSENTLTDLHPFYEGTFIEAAAMDSDNYFIASSAGLFWYRLSKNSLVPFIPGIRFGQIACDDISQLIYAASGKDLKVYSFTTAALVANYSLPDTLVDLHLVFNK